MLVGSKNFNDFILQGSIITNNSANNKGFGYYVNGNNYVRIFNFTDALYLATQVNGVVNNKSLAMPINAFDKITYILKKKGISLKLIAFINDDYGNPYIIDHVADLAEGVLLINNYSTLTSYMNVSITEITHAHHADIAEVAKGLIEQPFCKVRSTVDQSIATTTESVAIVFNTVVTDNRNHFDISTPTELVIREAGVYSILGSILWQYHATGYRRLRIAINGVVEAQISTLPLNPNNSDQVKAEVRLKVGDKISLQVWQNSGGALSVISVSYAPYLVIAKIG
jgi:hypothetical protein